MPSQVLTKRRMKRRQQRHRLVSKNAKRKVRSSVRKHRKTAKKVMRGGGPIWSQSFSVVDKSPGKDLIKRENVFKLSVSKPLFGNKKFNIQLVFDLNKYPNVKENESNMDESINRIIVKLLEHIFGSKIYTGQLYGDNQNVDFPSKMKAIKADERNSTGDMSVEKLITKEGTVGKPCTINMSIRKEKNDNTSLFLDDYTEIFVETIFDHRLKEQVLDNFRFKSQVMVPYEHTVYKWLQTKTDLKITQLDTPPFTEETLKTKLDELKDKTDNEYMFYQLIHDIKIENTKATDIQDDTKAVRGRTYENETINLKNGDKFVGTYEISRSFNNIRLIEGKYTWSDGTVYQGNYYNPGLCFGGCDTFKNEGEYTWPDNTTYKGSFKVDIIRPTRRMSKYVENNDNQLWIFDFNKGFLTRLSESEPKQPEVDAAQVSTAEKQPIE